jgi:hypothetical protein
VEKTKVLIATYRGHPEGAAKFFSGAVQPFLEETVHRGRKNAAIIYEGMLYRIVLDFPSAQDVMNHLGTKSDEKLVSIQLSLNFMETSFNRQISAINVGKQPLIPIMLGFEDFVRRVNYFSKKAIVMLIEPQSAQATYYDAEAAVLEEKFETLHDFGDRLHCMSELIILSAKSRKARFDALRNFLPQLGKESPGIALVLPRGPGNLGLEKIFDVNQYDLRMITDGSPTSFSEQAVAAIISRGQLETNELLRYSALQISYMNFIEANKSDSNPSEVMREGIAYALSKVK